MTAESNYPAIGEIRHAQPLGVERWVDAAGQPLADFDLGTMGDGYKLLFCYQHACPGCHTHGFPTLIRLIESSRGQDIRYAVIQTVFEDWDENSYEAMLQDQRRYALLVPFGYDPAPQDGIAGSMLMRRYGNGGTPWFILIAPDGTIVHSHFHIDVEQTMKLIRTASNTPEPAAASKQAPDWADVVRWATHGNPPPPRRVEKTESQWRELLTPEQYFVTREKGTEPAHSSAMCSLFEPGRYQCVGCGTQLFDSSAKYDSRSGWPSFTQPVAEGVVAYRRDASHGMDRIETVCQVCDAHLGHVFPDGPAPSGLRYCINALSLRKSA